jgi:hypothetical protein
LEGHWGLAPQLQGIRPHPASVVVTAGKVVIPTGSIAQGTSLGTWGVGGGVPAVNSGCRRPWLWHLGLVMLWRTCWVWLLCFFHLFPHSLIKVSWPSNELISQCPLICLLRQLIHGTDVDYRLVATLAISGEINQPSSLQIKAEVPCCLDVLPLTLGMQGFSYHMCWFEALSAISEQPLHMTAMSQQLLSGLGHFIVCIDHK